MKKIKTIKLLVVAVALMMISVVSNAQTSILNTNNSPGWTAFSLPTPGAQPSCSNPVVTYNFANYGGQPAGWQNGFAPNIGVTFPTPGVMWVTEFPGAEVHGALFQNNFPVINPLNPHWLVFRANNEVQIYINGNLIPGGPFNWVNGFQTICIPSNFLIDGNNLLTMQVTEFCDNGTQIQLNLWTDVQATITPGNQTLCVTDTPITLTGNPAGGTWAGNGISSAGVFTPSASNVGINNISYTVIAGACTTVANVIIEVDSFCCPDECYWTVKGNDIQNGNNIFGTTSNHDIELRTNNNPIGIINTDGQMSLGTMAPQSKLHVHNTSGGSLGGHLTVSGHHPSVEFYNAITSPGFGADIGLATGTNHWSLGAQDGDFVMRNTFEEGSLIFATNKIGNDGAERMRIDHNGLVGINTKYTNGQPTAYLHVNCAGNNEDNQLSDVRFERLERGEGDMLVIDAAGYVYRSNSHGEGKAAPGGDQSEEITKLKEQLAQEKLRAENLESEVNSLKSKVDIIFEKVNACCSNNSTEKPSFKVYPNPASDEISTEQYIPMNSENAQLVITDMAGRTIKTVDIHCTGLCNLKIDLPKTISGSMIICTLNIDNTAVDSKKIMLLRK
jgi:hypothetical protein